MFAIMSLTPMSNTVQVRQPGDIVPVHPDAAIFHDLAELVKKSVAASSARVYDQTFRLWLNWCAERDVSPLDFRPAHLLGFLSSQDTTKTTRQRQLSALRKVVSVLFIAEPTDDHKRLIELLKFIKAPAPEKRKERDKRALTPAQADRLLRTWDGDGLLDKRNRALVAVLLLTGIRRSEAAALRWADVDFDNGVLHVRHGKGDKARDVPVAGDKALEMLRAWQLEQPMGYQHVFTPLRRGGHFTTDKPMQGTDVYYVVDKTEEKSGIAFKPHDCRRTFITEALATGTAIQNVQSMAGHARGETTLHYAQAIDARRLRKELRFRYGG